MSKTVLDKNCSLLLAHSQILERMEQSQPNATLNVDTIFTWQPAGQEFNSQCHLLIYYLSYARAVVIVTELVDNPGQSITDSVTQLVNLVCYRFGLAPSKVMWLEHSPAEYFKDEDTYTLVMLTLDQVIRQRVTQQSLEKLLGCFL